jgi:hypothetical protein
MSDYPKEALVFEVRGDDASKVRNGAHVELIEIGDYEWKGKIYKTEPGYIGCRALNTNDICHTDGNYIARCVELLGFFAYQNRIDCLIPLTPAAEKFAALVGPK